MRFIDIPANTHPAPRVVRSGMRYGPVSNLLLHRKRREASVAAGGTH